MIMKYTYIKNNIAGFYVSFDEPFDPELYNNIGSTWEDFLNGMWVLLNQDKVNYHRLHPEASVQEVWNLGL